MPERLEESKKFGFVFISEKRANGTKRLYMQGNVITTVGLERMASHLADSTPGKELFTHFALGSGTTLAEAIGNPALETQIYIEAFDNIFASGPIIFGYTSLVATDIGVGSYSIGEVGLFDALSGGNLIARQLLDTVISNFTGADQIDTLWGIVNL
ncbi:hypothetical protein LCGC14_0503920 [marine sediment metagenome]|uniref:Uncharacterized protein n=1 Tax=marine sediment metagenome TaxID=412755 RepID=A0A0F9SLE3_9ZZZZ